MISPARSRSGGSTSTTPGRFITGIAIDPTDPNHAYVSYTGYNAYTKNSPGHVFEATYKPKKKKAHFTDISYDLGDQPVTGLALYGNNRDLFAATRLRRPRAAVRLQPVGRRRARACRRSRPTG